MSTDKYIVHDRVCVRGQKVPIDESSCIDIPEEYNEDLKTIQSYAEELENARNELGRLMQVVSHLTHVCNMADRNLSNSKSKLIEGLGLGEGNWAIDFNSSPPQVARVLPVEKEVPRVV